MWISRLARLCAVSLVFVACHTPDEAANATEANQEAGPIPVASDLTDEENALKEKMLRTAFVWSQRSSADIQAGGDGTQFDVAEELRSTLQAVAADLAQRIAKAERDEEPMPIRTKENRGNWDEINHPYTANIRGKAINDSGTWVWEERPNVLLMTKAATDLNEIINKEKITYGEAHYGIQIGLGALSGCRVGRCEPAFSSPTAEKEMVRVSSASLSIEHLASVALQEKKDRSSVLMIPPVAFVFPFISTDPPSKKFFVRIRDIPIYPAQIVLDSEDYLPIRDGNSIVTPYDFFEHDVLHGIFMMDEDVNWIGAPESMGGLTKSDNSFFVTLRSFCERNERKIEEMNAPGAVGMSGRFSDGAFFFNDTCLRLSFSRFWKLDGIPRPKLVTPEDYERILRQRHTRWLSHISHSVDGPNTLLRRFNTDNRSIRKIIEDVGWDQLFDILHDQNGSIVIGFNENQDCGTADTSMNYYQTFTDTTGHRGTFCYVDVKRNNQVDVFGPFQRP